MDKLDSAMSLPLIEVQPQKVDDILHDMAVT